MNQSGSGRDVDNIVKVRISFASGGSSVQVGVFSAMRCTYTSKHLVGLVLDSS